MTRPAGLYKTYCIQGPELLECTALAPYLKLGIPLQSRNHKLFLLLPNNSYSYNLCADCETDTLAKAPSLRTPVNSFWQVFSKDL